MEYNDPGDHVDALEKSARNLPGAVIVTDREGRIHNMNLAARRLLGDPDGELSTADWPRAFGLYREAGAGLFPAQELPPVRALIELTDVPAAAMILRRRSDLQERRISMSSKPILSENGGADGVTTLIQEITAEQSGVPSGEGTFVQTGNLARFLDFFAESSRDVSRIADSVAALTSEIVGHLSAVTLLDPEGRKLSLAAFLDADPAVAEKFGELVEPSMEYLNGESLESSLIRSESPNLVPSENQPSGVAARMFGRFIEQMDIPSMLMVPLIGRAGAIGAISIFRHRGGEAYTAADRSFLMDVSNRTALAIENCLLFDSLQAEISARLTAAQALDISEERFQSIFESTSLGIKVLDLTGNILQTNSSFQKIIGYTEAEILGRRFYDFLHPADMERAVSTFQDLKSEGVSALRFQHRAIHKNGSTVWVNAIFSAVRKARGDQSLAFIVSILEDITEQKLFESEMAELKNRLQTTMEMERLRLAHELHDGPMQDLYTIIYEIEELRAKVDPHTRDSLRNMSQSIQAVLQDLRATAKDLRPPTISQFGLEKTIRSYVGDLQEKHPELTVHLLLASDHQLLPEEVRLALFRIYQQAMNNILRHAHATEVRVRFSFDAEEARLEISDNGKGFDVPSNWIDLVRKGHYGLAGSAERINALGGVFVVESRKSVWTTIRAIVPWKEHLE